MRSVNDNGLIINGSQTLSLTQKFVAIAPNGMKEAFMDPSGAAISMEFSG